MNDSLFDFCFTYQIELCLGNIGIHQFLDVKCNTKEQVIKACLATIKVLNFEAVSNWPPSKVDSFYVT